MILFNAMSPPGLAFIHCAVIIGAAKLRFAANSQPKTLKKERSSAVANNSAGNPGIAPGIPNRTLVVSDNLPALAALPDACIDLIYLDPPFNSKKQYSNPINIPPEYAHTLYRDYTEMGVKVVEPSFSDEWSMELYLQDAAGGIYPNPNWKHQWVTAIAEAYPALHSVLTSAGQAQDERLQGYLTFMAVRLLQMRRVLKDTGSLYLHCDPTASHYLKAVMDCIFGRENFRNEIVWERIKGAGKGSQFDRKAFGRSSDTILFYTKSGKYPFGIARVAKPYDDAEKAFPFTDRKGRYKRRSPFRPPGLGARPNLCYEYGGIVPPHPSGWTVNKANLQKLDEAGELDWVNGKVYRKQRPGPGVLPNNVWVDIAQVSGKEDTNYPTQKPLALLNRIIQVSSNPDDIVLDPFAGCATACVAAEQLGRRWLGIEIGEEGYRQVVQRMRDTVKIASKNTPLLLEPERLITRLEELPGQRTDYPMVPPATARKGGGRTAAPPRVKVEDRTKQWLFGVQQGYCIGCAAALPLHILAVDHAIPRAAGGPDEEWNYQLLCSYCNPVKGDRLTTQQLWEVNQVSGVLTDIERVRRLWKAREGERRNQRFPGWPLN